MVAHLRSTKLGRVKSARAVAVAVVVVAAVMIAAAGAGIATVAIGANTAGKPEFSSKVFQRGTRKGPALFAEWESAAHPFFTLRNGGFFHSAKRPSGTC